MEYTYSFRIYPNEEQIILISKIFGCCRFIYNYFLDYSNSNGYSSKYTNNNTCNKELKVLYPWLREVDKFAITNATIKKYSNNKYKVMLLVRKEIKKLETNSYIVGIDMGVSNFVHDSSNNIYNAPKELMNTYDKIGKLQKSLSLKMKGSNNY